ncbi:ThuA domain-containing protein [Dyadobacter sediminis]|uniref:ThuA domain-containing protein n=1 Tax=Dyadobacter sediminis TaxID=1493691 RepID=A0A5R9K8B1_9BACT|nr:ThuA domain-containing protein [Dyadobacter sediminis]TLU90326.1 ThuA domain-containing protein [Dyadobacter sediminis]
MKRTIKITLWILLCIILFAGATTGIFFYKIKNGFPVSYETEKPAINFPPDQSAVLIFSKTTGFRHAESIEASLPVFSQIARKNNWFIYQTEEGGIFNPEQLKRFKVVIFNNSTGRVLNDEQQKVLSQYVESGGTLLGIHGAGDDSHHWPWYQTHLLGTKFSHHPLNPQFQKADVHVEVDSDSSLTRKLPAVWTNQDEWYVFLSQPKGMQILSYINGDKIIPNGNLLWIRDKDFGMGQYHPVAWYRNVGKGKTFYTSMGHGKEVWQNENFVQMIENAMIWSE